MPEPRWRFAEMPPAAINENPVQGEFFTAASDLPERFVREAIQNSLDAKDETRDGPVRVRFAFSETPLPATAAGRYVEGIRAHLEGVAQIQPGTALGQTRPMDELTAVREALDLLDRDMSSLVVEDFGTTGLTGRVDANEPLEEGNDF